MANTLLHKSASTAGKIPAASALTVRELAINTADGIVYTKTSGGVVKAINPNQYQARLTTASNGLIAVTFPTGLFTSIPVVKAMVECPTADQSSYTYNVELIGAPSLTGCTLRVTRIPLTISILLLGTVTIAGAAPAGIFVDVAAEVAT